jgi:abortive phage resistance protein AbiGi (putative antitoxin)
MPLIHFSFGSLHRSGEHSEQVEKFLSDILLPKRLKSFGCLEFQPIINNPNAKMANPNSVVPTGDGGVTFAQWIKPPPVSLLQQEVYMICFADIPFKKLKAWSPNEHYGKLGIAFTNKFRKRNNVRNVSYYQYPDLSRDNLVIELNKKFNEQMLKPLKDQEKIADSNLFEEVVMYRKPAKLWREINDLFAPLKITKTSTIEVEIEKLTYSRYEIEYDFQVESEARLITSKEEDNRLISFDELDVVAVIAPDEKSKHIIETELKNNWEKPCEVILYPN